MPVEKLGSILSGSFEMRVTLLHDKPPLLFLHLSSRFVYPSFPYPKL